MRFKVCFILFIGIMCGAISAQSQDSSSQTKLRTLVNLLDYIGKDYPNAVKGSTVISNSEYQEMSEFSEQTITLHRQLKGEIQDSRFASAATGLKQLKKIIQQKASRSEVATLASDIQQRILALDLITIIPSAWPDMEHGKELFAQSCQSCHGKEGFGNGPLAADLSPKPTNFHDSSLAAKLSPLQAFNTIRLGIEGTGMRAFTELSNKEVWDIAFYINKLNYEDNVPSEQQKEISSQLQDTVSLHNLSTWKNEQWIAYFNQHNINAYQGLSVLRSLDAPGQNQQKQFLTKTINLLKQSQQAYASGETEAAQTLALNAYLHGVEPVENEIRATDPSLVTELENKMLATRSAMKQQKSPEDVQAKIEAASLAIERAQNVLQNQDYSFWFTFTMAASILLREGLEAVLIILVIISVLKSMGAERSLKYVHGGWMSALLIGIISWFFASSLIQMNPFHREVMEGIGSLIAVGMLLYIGFWLHNKTHASQWTKFVKKEITRLVDDNNRWGLASLAFIVVFREAFESVIFLSSISIKSSTGGNNGILLGSAGAIISVLLFAVLMIKFSKRLPIRTIFKYSSFIMAILAVVLVGKGMHAFQEAGYLAIHSLPHLPDFPLLGLYPTLFTLLAQIAIAALIIGLRRYSKRLAIAQR